MKRLLAAITVFNLALPVTWAQESRPEQRQENRETRQEARQEVRQETQKNREQTRDQDSNANQRQENREDRREARQQRLGNRSQYYSNDTWNQLDPWIKRNNLTPMERLARAAGVAAGVTEKALNTANEVADRANNQASTRYGYMNPNGPGENGWFYDYYSYSPTSYNAPATGSNIYGSATRYYDLDGDGVYENLNVFRDSDSNASYDIYDRYDFAGDEPTDKSRIDKNQPQSAEDLVDSPEDANRHTVSGKVYASKSAKVNGNENLIVRLSEVETKGDKQSAPLIDIGPVAQWKEHPLQVNAMLSATGPIERIGDKRILIAESVKVGDGRELSIARGAPKMEGQVVDVTEAQVKGKTHTLAVIEAESKRQLVDLGPAENLKVKVEPQTKIIVQGVPVRVRNHSIVQAERVSIDGQDITIRRW